MLAAAAFVPVPPLLVPEIAGGSAAADESMRAACGAAVRRLSAATLDELIVVGAGACTGEVTGSWDWRGFGVASPAEPPADRLPHALAIGAWLLQRHGGPNDATRFQAISEDLPAADCADLGRALAGGERRVGLLVCGDGSACRTEKAPGYFDPDAPAWDEAALAALRRGEPTGLLALDGELGARLLAAGRAPWQVLAGAAGDDAFDATVDWADAPYGVMYVVGTWMRKKGTR
jgi:hypothetical protein